MHALTDRPCDVLALVRPSRPTPPAALPAHAFRRALQAAPAPAALLSAPRAPRYHYRTANEHARRMYIWRTLTMELAAAAVALMHATGSLALDVVADSESGQRERGEMLGGRMAGAGWDG